MAGHMTLVDFLDASNITEKEWNLSGANWDILEQISSDYQKRLPALNSSAENIASRVRSFPGVHSVRTRIKDRIHLLKKIVRKKIELAEDPDRPDIDSQLPQTEIGLDAKSKYLGVSKWLNVDVNNYLEIVTDLIGVRALHLFMDECVGIDEAVRNTWELAEVPVAYLRKGDHLQEAFTERGGTTATHPFGYRSIHYIIKTRPELKEFRVEVQVRTIFQEGWSEIDHKIRYPDFSKNPQVAYFLDIFNVLAGSADSMGSFVKDLVKSASEYEIKISLAEQANADKDEIIKNMKSQLASLKNNKTLKSNKEAMQVVNNFQDNLSALSAKEKALQYFNKVNSANGMFSEAIGLNAGSTLFDNIMMQRLSGSDDAQDLYKKAMEAATSTSSVTAMEAYEAIKRAQGDDRF